MDQGFTSGWVSSWVEALYNWLVQHAFKITLMVVLLTLVATLGLRLFLIFNYFPEIGGIESNVIYSFQRILAGYPLYTDPEAPPYSITQYTPLYYGIAWMVGKIFQIDPSDVHAVYVLSRSLSLLFNLLFSLVTVLILYRIFKINRLFCAVAFTYALVFLDEESYSRPDSLYNLMVLTTILFFLKFLQKNTRRERYLLLSSALSILTIFTKQSGIYIPIVLVFFTLFYIKSIRWALLSILTMAVSFGVLLFLCSGGDLNVFWQNTVQGVNNGMSLGWFAERIMIEHFQKERWINILGLFLGLFFWARGSTPAQQFLGIATLASFTFALVTSVKIGAAPNYFTEFITLTIILAIVFIVQHDSIFSDDPTITTGKSYKPLVYLLLVIFTLPPRLAGKYVKKVGQMAYTGQQLYEDNHAVAEYLYQEESITAEDQVLVTTHVQDYLNKFLYRNVIFPQKEIVVANPPGTYDYSAFKEGIQDGSVGYVIASIAENHVDTVAAQLVIDFHFIDTDFSNFIPIKAMRGYVIFRNEHLRSD